MKFKVVLLAVLLIVLVTLGGCNCTCSKTSCPMSQEATASTCEADSSLQ